MNLYSLVDFDLRFVNTFAEREEEKHDESDHHDEGSKDGGKRDDKDEKAIVPEAGDRNLTPRHVFVTASVGIALATLGVVMQRAARPKRRS